VFFACLSALLMSGFPGKNQVMARALALKQSTTGIVTRKFICHICDQQVG
jgi:hypothetical protein